MMNYESVISDQDKTSLKSSDKETSPSLERHPQLDWGSHWFTNSPNRQDEYLVLNTLLHSLFTSTHCKCLALSHQLIRPRFRCAQTRTRGDKNDISKSAVQPPLAPPFLGRGFNQRKLQKLREPSKALISAARNQSQTQLITIKNQGYSRRTPDPLFSR